MSHFSKRFWGALSVLLAFFIALSSLQPAQQATAQSEASTPTATPTATASTIFDPDDLTSLAHEAPYGVYMTDPGIPQTYDGEVVAPELLARGDGSKVTVVLEPKPSSVEGCYEWVWDNDMPIPSMGTWDQITWPQSPTTGSAYADLFGDGATVTVLLSELPEWGSPTRITLSWYRFSLSTPAPGATFAVEVTLNREPTGLAWWQRSEEFSMVPTYHQVEGNNPNYDGAVLHTDGHGRQLGWDRFRIFKCYDGVALPTATPTRTSTPTATPTRTFTPTPCPTFPPLPTPTATPTPGGIGQVIPGDATCRHSTSLPIAGLGSRDVCPIRAPASPQEVAASAALQELPACLPVDAAVAEVMRRACGGSFFVEWQVSDGRVIVSKKLTCSSHRPQDAGGVFFKALLGLSAAEIAAIIAAATASGAVVIGVVVIGGVVYLIVTYDGPPAVNWIFVQNETLLDEWVLAQSSAGMWPAAPLGVRTGPVQSAGAPVVVKFYDNGWGNSTRQMWIIDATSRPSGLGVSAMLQIQRPDSVWSVLVVDELLPTDRALIAQPVTLTFPEDAANVLTDDIGDNAMLSDLHWESEHILQSVNTGGLVRARGNPDEPDSIVVYGGVDPVRRKGRVAVLWRDGWKSAYVLYEFAVQPNSGPGLFQLGSTGWWYSRWGVRPVCAWFLSYLQGREEFPEWALLPSHIGKARFMEIVGKYNLSRIAELYLPI